MKKIASILLVLTLLFCSVASAEIAKEDLPPGRTLTIAARPLTSLGTSGRAIGTEFRV